MVKWRRARRPFSYQKYVNPQMVWPKEVEEWQEASTRRELLERICDWIAEEVKLLKVQEPGSNYVPLYPNEILRRRETTCLGRSILYTSIIRSLGVSEKEIFIIIATPKKAEFPNSVHSNCIAETKEGNRNIVNCSEHGKFFNISFTRRQVSPLEIWKPLRMLTVPIIFNDEIALVSSNF